MISFRLTTWLVFSLLVCVVVETEAGVIKDLFHKITGTNNRTRDTVQQSAPICGNGLFSTPDERSLSPELIFITNQPARSQSNSNYKQDITEQQGESRKRNEGGINEVAKEFSFNAENVTLQELERHGFNRDAPATFLIHGFTSGYPLQAWISAIVESYTIDRESSSSASSLVPVLSEGYNNYDHHQGIGGNHNYGSNYRNSTVKQRKDATSHRHSTRANIRVDHNLFIVNWNYAARGILYPRAVANIPIVATYVTRFINEKLLAEARMDPRRIQLIGHSLGAHLAGFIGKNTDSKLGRIYGLDPAGPCFGALSGPLYPSSKRLAPTDAEEVITVQTNSALLGIDKPLGKYSVFVEGGEIQPGCKDGGLLKSIGSLTWDGGDFDTLSCSHSRAPNLLSYRHNQGNSDDDCQMIAYECKDWHSFVLGHCGQCKSSGSHYSSTIQDDYRKSYSGLKSPMEPVECLRVGLDWQYPGKNQPTIDQHERPSSEWQRPTNNGFSSSTTSDLNYHKENTYHHYSSSTSRRPTTVSSDDIHYTSGYVNNGYESDTSVYGYNESYTSSSSKRRLTTKRPLYSLNSSFNQRDRRETAKNSVESDSASTSRRHHEDISVTPKSMFMRTGDTQPYCAYQYQVILELNEPFAKKKPSMSLILQDSEAKGDHEERITSSSSGSSTNTEQNSLTDDQFGSWFNDRIYTDLLTSGRKLKSIEHATLLFREGAPEGKKVLKALHINYMSHIDAKVRQKFSSILCPVNTETDRRRSSGLNRFYFEACKSTTSPP